MQIFCQFRIFSWRFIQSSCLFHHYPQCLGFFGWWQRRWSWTSNMLDNPSIAELHCQPQDCYLGSFTHHLLFEKVIIFLSGFCYSQHFLPSFFPSIFNVRRWKCSVKKYFLNLVLEACHTKLQASRNLMETSSPLDRPCSSLMMKSVWDEENF